MPAVGAAIVTLFSGAAFGGGLAGAVAAFAAKSALSFGISKLAASMADEPTESGGIKTTTTMAGEDTPQSIIFGRYATGGAAVAPPYVFDFRKDDDGEYLVYVVALSDMPINALESVIIDGRACTIAATQRVPGNSGYILEDNYGRRLIDPQGKLDGFAWVRVFDGTQTAADPKLIEMFGGHYTRPWDETMILTGVAYAVLTFKYRSEKFTGLPDCRYVVQGAKLLDPRTNSVGFTRNPVVMAWNVIRGITLPGTSGVWGINAPISSLPNAAWFAAMNACDEVVNGAPRYRAGTEITLDAEPLSVIDELMRACGGQIAECGGTYNISVGAPPVAVASISDDDVIISEDREFIVHEGLAKVFNGATATYPDPAQLWEQREAVPYKNLAWVAQDDGRESLASLSLAAVPYPEQVRRLMRELAADNRRQRRHIITVGPWALALKPLQTLVWTSPNNGYVAKLFEITSLIINPDSLNVTLALRERDPSDYDYDAVSDGTLPASPSVLPNDTTISTVMGFVAEGTSLKGDNGAARRPALRLSWSSGAPYQSISYEVRVKTTTEVSLRGSITDVSAGTIVLAAGILPSTQYECRARARARGRETAWTAWATATTPGVFIGDDDFEDGVRGLFEGAGMRGIEYMSSLPIPGGTVGRTVFLTTDSKLYRWTGSAWVEVVAHALQGVLDQTHFAQGISIPKVVSALPTTGNFVGRMVVLSTDGKLYRWTGSAWTAAVPAADVIGKMTAEQIDNLAIDARHLMSGAVGPTKIEDGAITTPKIRAGAVAADQIAAGAIVASKLAVSDYTNLVPDSELKDVQGWNNVANDGTGIFQLRTSGNPFIKTEGDLVYWNARNTGNANVAAFSGWAPVSQTDVLYVAAQAIRSGGTKMRIYFGVQFADKAKAVINTQQTYVVNGSENTTEIKSGEAVAPAGAYFVRFIFNVYGADTDGNVIFGSPTIRFKNKGELIVDGAITANKIGVGEVKADNIESNSITTAKIAAGAVAADQIAAGAIVASKLAITDLTVLVPDDQLLDRTAWTFTVPEAMTFMSSSSLGTKPNSLGFIRCTGGTSLVRAHGKEFPVDAGAQYFCGGTGWRQSGTYGWMVFHIQFRNADGAWIQAQTIFDREWATDGTGSGAYTYGDQTQSKSITAPAGAVSARVLISLMAGSNGNWVAATPIVRRKNGGELIVDGSITGDKIKANTIHGGLMEASGIITKAGQITDAVITNAKIANATITSLKIGNNQLFVPYSFTWGDRLIPATTNRANPLTIFNQVIPDFAGGGYEATFSAIMDCTNRKDTFGSIILFIDNVEVARSRFGIRTSNGDTEFIMPISLSSSANGSATTRVMVQAYSSHWDSDTSSSGDFVLRQMKVSLNGTRR